MRVHVNATDIAWAAGLFEGEGSFSTMLPAKGTRRYLRIGLQTTNLDVLERFQAIIGCGAIYDVRPDPRNPNGKRVYSWQASGEVSFRAAVRLFAPYLGERRAARAAELLREHGTIHEGQTAITG